MAVKKKGKLAGGDSPGKDQDLLYSAQQIWQAGLGALGRAQAGAPKAFEDLLDLAHQHGTGLAPDGLHDVGLQVEEGLARPFLAWPKLLDLEAATFTVSPHPFCPRRKSRWRGGSTPPRDRRSGIQWAFRPRVEDKARPYYDQ